MTSINKFDRALGSLRKALSRKLRTDSATSSTNSAAPSANNNPKAGSLQTRVALSIQGIDLSTESGQQQATRIFLESVLADEFGTEILNDPAFSELIQDVRQTMLSDSAIHQKLLTMLKSISK